MECALCLLITASLRQVHIRGRGGHVHGGGLAAGRRPALPHPARGCLQRAPGVALRVRDGAGARLPARTERAAQVTTHTVTLTNNLDSNPSKRSPSAGRSSHANPNPDPDLGPNPDPDPTLPQHEAVFTIQ